MVQESSNKFHFVLVYYSKNLQDNLLTNICLDPHEKINH